MTTKYASETNLVLNKSQNGNQVGKVNKLSISWFEIWKIFVRCDKFKIKSFYVYVVEFKEIKWL